MKVCRSRNSHRRPTRRTHYIDEEDQDQDQDQDPDKEDGVHFLFALKSEAVNLSSRT